jgi:membrane protein implicated in regulation of membrane protease activity
MTALFVAWLVLSVPLALLVGRWLKGVGDEPKPD